MTTRVQIELGDKAMKRLRDIKGITEAGSYVEVIKQALVLYERMIKLDKEGGTINIVSKSGEAKQLEIIY